MEKQKVCRTLNWTCYIQCKSIISTLLGDSQSKVSRPNIEKDGDLPSANLSKIQSLYKKILSASENPAIIDWVKAAETKISNLERELENTSKALDVSQQTCEHYQKQVGD